MPNYVTTRLTFPDTNQNVGALLQPYLDEQGNLDFNRITPMPPILRHVRIGARSFDGVSYRRWYCNSDAPDEARPLTEDELAAIEATGSTDWYDWSCKNWGTKWNAHHCVPLDGAYFIDTAWSPAYPIFARLSSLLDTKVVAEFVDEGWCFAGLAVFADGGLEYEQDITCDRDSPIFASLYERVEGEALPPLDEDEEE